MSRPVCTECGDAKPLNEDGVCRNRHGCEHRQLQHAEAVARLLEEFEDRDFTVRAKAAYEASRQAAQERHPSNQYLPPISEGGHRTNLWLDQFLHGNGGADDTDLDDGDEL